MLAERAARDLKLRRTAKLLPPSLMEIKLPRAVSCILSTHAI